MILDWFLATQFHSPFSAFFVGGGGAARGRGSGIRKARDREGRGEGVAVMRPASGSWLLAIGGGGYNVLIQYRGMVCAEPVPEVFEIAEDKCSPRKAEWFAIRGQRNGEGRKEWRRRRYGEGGKE
jgi:hypothetical protein